MISGEKQKGVRKDEEFEVKEKYRGKLRFLDRPENNARQELLTIKTAVFENEPGKLNWGFSLPVEIIANIIIQRFPCEDDHFAKSSTCTNWASGNFCSPRVFRLVQLAL